LSLFVLPKGLKRESFVVVGSSKVGVQADGLLISGERFLVALEIAEGIALAEVSVGIVGVQVDGLLISGERFLVPLEAMEGIALAEVGVGIVGV